MTKEKDAAELARARGTEKRDVKLDVRIRCSSNEAEQFRLLAEYRQEPLSDLVRALLLAAVEIEFFPKKPPEGA